MTHTNKCKWQHEPVLDVPENPVANKTADTKED